jgi:hypothetical protein
LYARKRRIKQGHFTDPATTLVDIPSTLRDGINE